MQYSKFNIDVIKNAIKRPEVKQIKFSNLLKRFLQYKNINNNHPDFFCFKLEESLTENYYRISYPRKYIEDQNSKEKFLLIYKAKKEYEKVNNYLINFHFKNFLFGSFLFTGSIYLLNSYLILGSFFYMITLKNVINKSFGFNYKIINYIYVKECGQKLIIYTLLSKFEENIINVRKLKKSEYFFFQKLYRELCDEYIPIVINYEVYLLPKIYDYLDKEIFFAINNSSYIINE
jgi:hypothetical protein